MDIVGCPFCGTGNRLGKAFCKKCMRPIPQVEDVIKPKKKVKKLNPLDISDFDTKGLHVTEDKLTVTED